MDTTNNAGGTQTSRIRILSKKWMDEMADLGSAFNLRNLLDWVKKLLALLLAPFRLAARWVDSLGGDRTSNEGISADTPVHTHASKDRADGEVDSAADGGRADTGNFSREVAVELTGPEDQIEKARAMILSTIETILKNPEVFSSSPDDHAGASVAIMAMGDESEKLRYAHKLSVHQAIMLAADITKRNPKFTQQSPESLIQYVKTCWNECSSEYLQEDTKLGTLAAMLTEGDRMQVGFHRHIDTAVRMCALFDGDKRTELQDIFAGAAQSSKDALDEEERQLFGVETKDDVPALPPGLVLSYTIQTATSALEKALQTKTQNSDIGNIVASPAETEKVAPVPASAVSVKSVKAVNEYKEQLVSGSGFGSGKAISKERLLIDAQEEVDPDANQMIM